MRGTANSVSFSLAVPLSLYPFLIEFAAFLISFPWANSIKEKVEQSAAQFQENNYMAAAMLSLPLHPQDQFLPFILNK